MYGIRDRSTVHCCCLSGVDGLQRLQKQTKLKLLFIGGMEHQSRRRHEIPEPLQKLAVTSTEYLFTERQSILMDFMVKHDCKLSHSTVLNGIFTITVATESIPSGL